MKKLIKIGFITCTLGLVFLAACKKDTINDKAPIGPKFDLDKFDDNIRASIGPSDPIGWSYVITQNGLYAKGGAFGKARNTADGNIALNINKQINLASVTKWFTAIAAMKLLYEKGLDENELIASYLPPAWSKGPGVNGLTFGDLLGHRSGLSSYNTQFSRTLTYSGLRRMIDTGVVRTKGNYDYLNANFALFRILIPSLWKGMQGAPNIATLDSATTEAAYIQYMQEKIFEPVGLIGIDCEDEARDKATLYYSKFDLNLNPGTYYGSWTRWAGGGGLYMSAMEVATVLAYYRHSNVLLPKNVRDVMELKRFGYEGKDNSREIHGNYFSKGGSIADGSPSPKGVLTDVVCFPNGVEIVVLCNSQGMTFAGGVTNLRIAIYDAYNKAWD